MYNEAAIEIIRDMCRTGEEKQINDAMTFLYSYIAERISDGIHGRMRVVESIDHFIKLYLEEIEMPIEMDVALLLKTKIMMNVLKNREALIERFRNDTRLPEEERQSIIVEMTRPIPEGAIIL